MILRGLLPLALLVGSTSCSATWEGMQTDAGELFGGSREPETAATRPASVESVVMEAQKALAERGYDVGAPDGLVGPRTTRAIFAYQRDHDLPRTGYVDDELLDVADGIFVDGVHADSGSLEVERVGQVHRVHGVIGRE